MPDSLMEAWRAQLNMQTCTFSQLIAAFHQKGKVQTVWSLGCNKKRRTKTEMDSKQDAQRLGMMIRFLILMGFYEALATRAVVLSVDLVDAVDFCTAHKDSSEDAGSLQTTQEILQT